MPLIRRATIKDEIIVLLFILQADHKEQLVAA